MTSAVAKRFQAHSSTIGLPFSLCVGAVYLSHAFDGARKRVVPVRKFRLILVSNQHLLSKTTRSTQNGSADSLLRSVCLTESGKGSA